MKGGFHRLKISQVSLILITFVCATVITLAWTKTPFLMSLIPAQNRFLWVFSDEKSSVKQVFGGNSSGPSETIVETVAKINSIITNSSTGTKGKENSKTPTDEIPEIPPTIKDRSSASETSEGESSSKQVENDLVPASNTFSTNSTNKIKQNENVTTPTGTEETTESSGIDVHNVNVTAPIERQDCNYVKGKWIMDPKRPLYSGFGCKQWLSPAWACRLTQRTDFEYELLRWQPKNCKMEEFTSSRFLSRMVNKTLAFIGDSLGRQQFQSMMCMLTGGEGRPDVHDVGKEYGLVKARGAMRPDGWAYRFPSTNTTILYYWSASLCDLEPINRSNPLTDIAMHLDHPPAFLRHYIHKIDVVVLNTGHHWNRGKLKANRWVMYVEGVPNTNRKIADIAGAKNFTVYSTIHWINSQLPKYPGLKVFYRSISPRHFFNGDWNTGGTCDNTTPLSTGKEVLKDESSDPLAFGAARGTDVKLLDITALSEVRDEGHVSRYSIRATPGVQDCLHWCLPGVPDTWNEILFAQI